MVRWLWLPAAMDPWATACLHMDVAMSYQSAKLEAGPTSVLAMHRQDRHALLLFVGQSSWSLVDHALARRVCQGHALESSGPCMSAFCEQALAHLSCRRRIPGGITYSRTGPTACSQGNKRGKRVLQQRTALSFPIATRDWRKLGGGGVAILQQDIRLYYSKDWSVDAARARNRGEDAVTTHCSAPLSPPVRTDSWQSLGIWGGGGGAAGEQEELGSGCSSG